MTRILNTQNAQITTATVQVQTLTISGKQVTLSVFRQLREHTLMFADASLTGVPWGYVNYHPDKCGSDDEHLHVVYQSGDDLYRSRVDRPSWAGKYFWSDGADQAIQGRYCENGHQRPKWLDRVDIWNEEEDGRYDASAFTIGGVQCQAKPVYMYHHSPADCMSKTQAKKAWDGLEAEVAEEAEARKALRKRWAELSALPHLFIAV